mmetsp:Transcript_4433/g.10109  ORF Transcript_4433/g.10109 Transcript_4433/m.10109 type:complete len:397 (-) Transcript_4433:178-1368(-)
MSFLAEDPDADADAHSPVSSLIISDALGNSLITYFPGSRFESGTIAKTVATIGAMSPSIDLFEFERDGYLFITQLLMVSRHQLYITHGSKHPGGSDDLTLVSYFIARAFCLIYGEVLVKVLDFLEQKGAADLQQGTFSSSVAKPDDDVLSSFSEEGVIEDFLQFEEHFVRRALQIVDGNDPSGHADSVSSPSPPSLALVEALICPITTSWHLWKSPPGGSIYLFERGRDQAVMHRVFGRSMEGKTLQARSLSAEWMHVLDLYLRYSDARIKGPGNDGDIESISRVAWYERPASLDSRDTMLLMCIVSNFVLVLKMHCEVAGCLEACRGASLSRVGPAADVQVKSIEAVHETMKFAWLATCSRFGSAFPDSQVPITSPQKKRPLYRERFDPFFPASG